MRARAALPSLLLAVVAGRPDAEDVILLKNEAGESLLLARPDGEGYLLVDPDGDEVFFEADSTLIRLPGAGSNAEGKTVVFRNGTEIEIHDDGLHTLADPPGYRLLDAHDDPIELGLDGPLIIEAPLPVDDEPETVSEVFVTLMREALEKRTEGLPGGSEGLGGLPKLLESPETSSELVKALLDEGRGGFLAGLELSFKALDLDDGESTLGLEYDFSRDLLSLPSETSTTYSGWSLEVHARGTVAFDERLNPADFLESRVAYRYYRSSGGVEDESAAPTPEEIQVRIDRAKAIWEAGDGFLETPEYQAHAREVRSLMKPQLHVDLGVEAGLESDQSFATKQYAYGLEGVIDYKVWNPDDPRSRLNLLDMPFAALRVLTGYDSRWQIRGSTFPTVAFAIEQVQPEGGTPREAAGDDSSFARIRTEASFRTPLASVGSSTVFFNANYRYFRELNASGAVKAADLEDSGYLALSLTTDAGFLVTYTTGMLPFDVQDGASLQAGWQFSF